MLEPLAVDPNRSPAPAANSIASARLVFPAPAGPTSAITRVPLDGCPAMRLSLRAVTGAASRSRERRFGACLETPTVRLFSAIGKGVIRADRVEGRGREGLGRGQQAALAREAQQRGLELLERADFDLADALAADAIDLAQFLERLGLVGEAALHQDMLLAIVQAFERGHQ